MSPQVEQILSIYRELERLDEQGKVTLVRHSETGLIAVRKVLHSYNAELYQYLRKNTIEGVPCIYEYIEDGDFLVVIEEYIQGETLRRYMEENGPVPEKKARDIVRKLCVTLQKLHGAPKPIVCRDLKPENIILKDDGAPVIIDFDAGKFVSKENSDTRLLGTMGYAAPEQFGFAASDERTDIYAVGVILNELLTGCKPNEKVATGVCHKIIVRCTNLDPAARPDSIREVRRMVSGNRWYPPGFRTGNPVNMVVAIILYAIILAFLGYTVDWSNKTDSYMMNAFWVLIVLWTVAFCGDYLGVRSRVPLVNEHSEPVAQLFMCLFAWAAGVFLLAILVAIFVRV